MRPTETAIVLANWVGILLAGAALAQREDSSNSGVPPAMIALVEEINLARTQPRLYAEVLREYAAQIVGNRLAVQGEPERVLREGKEAVDEAISFLEQIVPRESLKFSRGLSAAAADLVREQGRTGEIGHGGEEKSSPESRIREHGEWLVTRGENVSYGPSTARDIVASLIIDDGVPSRDHRVNIFDDTFTVVGVAAGSHPSFGTVCVQVFAGGFEPH